MSDLIERRLAIDAVREVLKRIPTSAIMAMEAIRGIPSAEPETIRCRDCVKRETCRTTNIWAVAPDDDWFCADAERRTE